ncbi:MAG: methylmalonyl Co-A mutase-associated GTPase MeaB [Desulfocucumaceae bacterium]
MDSIENLLDGFKNKNIRCLARLISKLENEDSQKEEILAKLYGMTGRAMVLGVTGSPGAGKSSLVDRLTAAYRKKGNTVGIIAVDPTSPFTGGALLGDRIRMQEHAVDRGVYIRSMGTRGSLGGLARATKEAVKLLDAFGFDLVIIETVGVGQAELDIMHVADTTLVVLTPGAGDSIQTIKAGIMEIADIFVVNKCDLQGADRVVAEIKQMLALQSKVLEWRPPVVKVSTLDDHGMSKLMETLDLHINYLTESGMLAENRAERTRREMLEIVDYKWHKLVNRQLDYKDNVRELLNEVISGKADPYSGSDQIIKYIIENTGLGAEGADLRQKGGQLLEILETALVNLKNFSNREDMSEYRTYLHGQIYGLATALKLLYPGPGNLGERAAMSVRPVITEHSCSCQGEE